MKRRTALAVIEAMPPAPAAPPAILEGLRRRLPPQTDKDAVVLDFLEDDLREAHDAIAAVGQYVGEVEASLGDAAAARDEILALALGRGPLEQVEYLAGILQTLRRRLVQVSARL
jgi:hypothetical protein